jgi:hypothetical protein
MQSRNVVLVAILLLLGAGYLWMFFARQVPPIEVQYLEPKGSGPVFSFNDRLAFREVQVFRLAGEPRPGEVYTGSEDTLVWHLVPNEPRGDREPIPLADRAVRAVVYGRNIRGMRGPRDGLRQALPLTVGQPHRFVATPAEGYGEGEPIQLDFVPGGTGGAASP